MITPLGTMAERSSGNLMKGIIGILLGCGQMMLAELKKKYQPIGGFQKNLGMVEI